MSARITLRLSAKELEQLDEMAGSEITGTENRTEFIRLLLAREWNRRKGSPKPTAAQFQSAFRIGRPVKQLTVSTTGGEIEQPV